MVIGQCHDDLIGSVGHLHHQRDVVSLQQDSPELFPRLPFQIEFFCIVQCQIHIFVKTLSEFGQKSTHKNECDMMLRHGLIDRGAQCPVVVQGYNERKLGVERGCNVIR